MKITFVAVDGFTGWLSPEDVDRSDWIFALEADGVPLGIGQQGPLWLINTRAEAKSPATMAAGVGCGECFTCGWASERVT